MSFYCKATLLMPAELIGKAIKELEKRLAVNQIDSSDVKAKAKILRETIQRLAQEAGIELRRGSK